MVVTVEPDRSSICSHSHEFLKILAAEIAHRPAGRFEEVRARLPPVERPLIDFVLPS